MHTLLPGTHELFLARGILRHNCATGCVDITNKVYLRWSGFYAGLDLDTQSWSGLLTASMQARQTRGSHSEKRQTDVHNQRIEHQPIPLMHLLSRGDSSHSVLTSSDGAIVLLLLLSLCYQSLTKSHGVI